MSRWVELYATSPSGKTLFVCRMCGRKSPTPDKTCLEPPEVYQRSALNCELLEEIEEAINEEQAQSPEVKEGKLVLVGEYSTSAGADDTSRCTVIWRTLESQWNKTDIYLKTELVKK